MAKHKHDTEPERKVKIKEEENPVAFGRQVQEPIGIYPEVKVDPRDVKLREVTPKTVTTENKVVVFMGKGSIHLTKKNGKGYPVRFEPGVLTASVSDPEIIEELRKRGYKEVQ